MEAINKIVKKYLRLKPAEDYEELEEQLHWIVEDYNKIRPHDSIGGLRPYEAYTQQIPNSDNILSTKETRAKRIEENKKVNCQLCQKSKN